MNLTTNPLPHLSQGYNSVAVPSTPPKAHLKAICKNTEEITLSQAFYESHKESIELAKRFRHDGRRHAALMNHIGLLRFYFKEHRALEQF